MRETFRNWVENLETFVLEVIFEQRSGFAASVTRGILFFEASNRGQTWDLTVTSLSKVFWNGVIYLPSVNLELHSWSADEGQKMAFAMVVNTLEINSWSGITNTDEWIPFNRTYPIRHPGTTTTEEVTETSIITETLPGWLSK